MAYSALTTINATLSGAMNGNGSLAFTVQGQLSIYWNFSFDPANINNFTQGTDPGSAEWQGSWKSTGSGKDANNQPASTISNYSNQNWFGPDPLYGTPFPNKNGILQVQSTTAGVTSTSVLLDLGDFGSQVSGQVTGEQQNLAAVQCVTFKISNVQIDATTDDISGDYTMSIEQGYLEFSNGSLVWVDNSSSNSFQSVSGHFSKQLTLYDPPAYNFILGGTVSSIPFWNKNTGDIGFFNTNSSPNTPTKAAAPSPSWVDIGGSSTAYSVVGLGDFYDVGTDDILFRNNATGDTGFYQINNGALAGWQDVGASSTAYSVVGTGDFYGAGTDDILFRNNSTGDTGFYAMSGGAKTGWIDVGPSSTAYAVVGIGDFTGSGTDDILFRNNSTGDTGFYAMSNGTNTGWHDVGGSSTAYTVVGVGNFMGTGTADILFRNNATGDTGFYAISNGANTGWHDIGASSTAYSVVAVGDYLGTGTSDILFRNNATGDTGFYAISNGVNTGWHDVGPSSTAYQVIG
jgi:hypothetical protein